MYDEPSFRPALNNRLLKRVEYELFLHIPIPLTPPFRKVLTPPFRPIDPTPPVENIPAH